VIPAAGQRGAAASFLCLRFIKEKTMTQSRLNRAVARVTGESLATIRNLGFSIADPVDVSFDPEPTPAMPQVVDWDKLDADRVAVFPIRQIQLAIAA